LKQEEQVDINKGLQHNPLCLEDQLVFDILGLLNRVPLSQRESILATVSSFVASEQEAYEEDMKRKLIGKLTSMGCRLDVQG
jgi:hypothetical protein